MTACQHALIFNEECIDSKNKYDIWFLYPKINHLTNFYVSPTSSCMKMTTCHHTLIFNAKYVNSKNKYDIWILRHKINHLTKFYVSPTLSFMKMRICHHWWIIDEKFVNFKSKYDYHIPWPIISHCTNYLGESESLGHSRTANVLLRRGLTLCHLSLIFNEWNINI